MPTKKPLDGILVVAVEQAVTAPLCSLRLADAGARVIKVERNDGDFARHYDAVANGESAYFVWLNRGKESVCLDLKNSDDVELLINIIDSADIFIQNLAPGVCERLGFGSDLLRQRNPALITLDYSGYGESGEYSQMKAYDLLIQCETGLASITGTSDAPGRVGVSICDIATGMSGHAAVLEALIHRQQTGEGCAIKLSLFDTIADWMTVPLLHQQYGGEGPPRVGIAHPSIAPYGAYPCGEDEVVVFAIQNEREWVRFCESVLAVGELASRPEFVSNSLRCEHRELLNQEIGKIFSDLSAEEIGNRLKAASIAYANLNSVADFANHPQLRRANVDSPHGDVALVARPAQMDCIPEPTGAVPALGEHTDAVRQEFSSD